MALRDLFYFWRKASGHPQNRPPTGHVGSDTVIHSRVQVLGWDNVFIGKDCVICEDSWFNINRRSDPNCRIEIGDHTSIGRRNFFAAGSLISVGPYCLTGIDCHFLGGDHGFESPFVPYAASPVTEGQDIRLGANCWLGARVTILKGVTIGYGSIVGAGSMVTKDVPPFSIAIGSPAQVVKRYDPVRKQWIPGAELPPDALAALPGELQFAQGLSLPWPLHQALWIVSGSDQGDLP